MQLRAYQNKPSVGSSKAGRSYDRVLGVVSTGAEQNRHRRSCYPVPAPGRASALFLAHRDELLDQAIDKLKRAAGIVAAREQAGSLHPFGNHFFGLKCWPGASRSGQQQ